MKTHEQLATLTAALEVGGWDRVNGNTWQWKTWQLTTGYTYQEATLTAKRVDGKMKTYYYRGADPLMWVWVTTVPFNTRVRKEVAKVLDTPL